MSGFEPRQVEKIVEKGDCGLPRVPEKGDPGLWLGSQIGPCEEADHAHHAIELVAKLIADHGQSGRRGVTLRERRALQSGR